MGRMYLPTRPSVLSVMINLAGLKAPCVVALVLTLGFHTRAADAPNAPAATPLKAVFKAGFAERDVTLDLGMEEPGGYGKVYHRTFHDPCKVRAAVFDDGRQRVALVGIDLLFITRALTKEARAEIEKRCGIKAGHILLGASHSHSSGPIGMSEPGDFDQAPPLVQDLYFKQSTISNPGYI